MVLSRRQLFLRGALATGGALVVGPCLYVGSRILDKPGDGLLALSRRERRILGSVIPALLPGGSGMPIGDPDVLTPSIDRYLFSTHDTIRRLFRVTLHLIEDLPVVYRGRRFSSLPIDQQASEIAQWEETTVYLKAASFSSVKLIVGMAYFETPEARAAVGWYLGCAPPHLVETGMPVRSSPL
jgi:hypothetical protein